MPNKSHGTWELQIWAEWSQSIIMVVCVLCHSCLWRQKYFPNRFSCLPPLQRLVYNRDYKRHPSEIQGSVLQSGPNFLSQNNQGKGLANKEWKHCSRKKSVSFLRNMTRFLTNNPTAVLTEKRVLSYFRVSTSNTSQQLWWSSPHRPWRLDMTFTL